MFPSVTSLKIPNVYSFMHSLPVSLIWPSFLSDAYLRLGRALRSLFPILVNFGCRAVRGLGRRARGRWHFAKVIQTLYKLVMIVRLAVQTKGLFTPSLGRAGGRAGWHLRRRCGRARSRHATVANHVLLLHHSLPPPRLHSVLSWLTRLFHPSMSCTGADLLYCSTRLCSTYVVGAELWMGVLSTHK